MKKITIGFIGLGLIGGSIAKAFREHLPHCHIIVYDLQQASCRLAVEEGVADEAADSIGSAFSSCDYIFLCAPVTENDHNLLRLSTFLSPQCIITDVGSVKGTIHEQIHRLGLTHRFIGGHPMAGSERFGYPNSKARLLENAYYILTPSEKISASRLEQFQELIRYTKAIPLTLDAAEHDYVTAAISHLPHILAASLVHLVREQDSPEGIMKMIAAGGFKDITRIASSSPHMWQQICLTNTDNILRLLDIYIEVLQTMRRRLEDQDADQLFGFFEEARIYRDSFVNTSGGPIKKSHSITVDIADETGALATIATMLATKNISIKNIGIVHNRELEEGALRIEFYEEDAMQTAGRILTEKGYHIYQKE